MAKSFFTTPAHLDESLAETSAVATAPTRTVEAEGKRARVISQRTSVDGRCSGRAVGCSLLGLEEAETRS